MASDSKELRSEIPNVIRVYKDGTVDRILTTPHVSPSLDDPNTGISSRDVVIVPDQVSARLYLPKPKPTKLPILVYFHGGGFVIGSAFTVLEHNYLTTIVSHINAIVVSVEYRLAPEHPLPAAYEDSWTALQWVASHKQPDPEQSQNQDPWLVEYGDFDRVYLGGDSAGGNIVHNVALRAGKEKLKNNVKIVGGFLGCPYFWSSSAGPTPDESLPSVCWRIAYPDAPDGIDSPLVNPFVKPGFATEYGCRKLLVVAAEKDMVKEMNVKYVEAVKECEWDGEVELFLVEGEDHCFYCFNGDAGKNKLVMDRLASFIV